SLTRAAPSVIYTLSLHDALPICDRVQQAGLARVGVTDDRDAGHLVGLPAAALGPAHRLHRRDLPAQLRDPLVDAPAIRLQLRLTDRKSTRLNSSHVKISYAVFCL